MSIFDLAMLELQREGIRGNNKNYGLKLIDRAVKIRKYLDIQDRNRKVAISRYNKI